MSTNGQDDLHISNGETTNYKLKILTHLKGNF